MSSNTKSNLFISISPVVQKLILTSGAVASTQISLESLSAQLCSTAENLYLTRDYVSLAQVADVLCTLPHEGARAAGMLYKARCLYNANRNDKQVITLLESASEIDAAPRTKARAIQALGVVYSHRGSLPEASTLLRAAIRSGDIVASIRAAFTFSELASTEGDHYQALNQLRAIRPAVELLSRGARLLLHQYANEVAFELSCVGRFEEARRYAQFAISSPFASAYPEWAETVQEIEQQAREKAARNRIQRPAVEQARKTSTKSKLRLVKKPGQRALPASTRRRTGPVAIIKPEQPRSRPTLEQICLKVRIRAPSF